MVRGHLLEWIDLGPRPRPGVTIAKNHPPFAASLNCNGGMVHRVLRVVIGWESGHPAQVGAVWSCNPGEGSLNVRLVTDPTGMRWCPRCDIAGVQSWPRVVYVGVDVDGRVKVGCTTNLAVRRQQLHIHILGFCPGDYTDESSLIAEMGDPVEGREWFAPGSEATALRWMANRKQVA
jgi:hypothetical protein